MSASILLYPDPDPGPCSGTCSLCGLPGDGQYLRNEILEKTSANLTALFDLNRDTICAHCVAVWREPKKWHRGVCADEKGVLFPVISRDSVTNERPLWADVLRSLDELPRVIVLTTDPKKRVWPFARVSSGDSACIYLHDPSRGVSGNAWVSLAVLRKTLTTIESAYNAGFSKEAIRTSLYVNYQQALGCPNIRTLEQSLIAIRNQPEFLPALIVAQKESPIESDPQALSISGNFYARNRPRRGGRKLDRPEQHKPVRT